MSKKKWAEPEAEWVPLKPAVFRFGISEVAASDLSSEQLFELREAETRASEIEFLSLVQLTKILKDKSGASYAEIDPSSATFSVLFSEGSPRRLAGTPWELLKNIPEVMMPTPTGATHPSLPPDYEEWTKRLCGHLGVCNSRHVEALPSALCDLSPIQRINQIFLRFEPWA
jgi:hypothetical protein